MADVSKALQSVRALVRAGHVVVFGDGSSDNIDQDQAVQWRVLVKGMRVVHPRRGRGSLWRAVV